MLKNDLYRVEQILREKNDNKISFVIRLDPDHEVFKGHFPGNPILPGVCIIQILKEVLMDISEEKIFLDNVSSIKYLSILNPLDNSMVSLDVEFQEKGQDNIIFCSAVLQYGSVVFCRLKGSFRVIRE
jgi:3-hydroxyacyl-[acyl-carrier-protein] dehydratase